MNIANEFRKISVFPADYRLVTVLEKPARSVMTMVERNNIPCKKLPHEKGDAGRSALKKEVCMIRHKCPGVTDCFCIR